MEKLTVTKFSGAVLGPPRAQRPGQRPVVLVQAGPADRASQGWALALAAGLRAELVDWEVGKLEPERRSLLSGLDELQKLALALRCLEPQLVVIPAELYALTACAGRLAESSGVPCLVARARHAHSTVLAATSLDDQRHPVIHAAARVADALGLPLTVVHNRQAAVIGAGLETVLVQRRLERLGTDLGAEVVVTRANDTVSGILGEARREDADLIVVGASRAPVTDDAVGARVAGLARRSVLVVPSC